MLIGFTIYYKNHSIIKGGNYEINNINFHHHHHHHYYYYYYYYYYCK